MRSIIKPFIVFFLAFLAGHLTVLHRTPDVIMNKTMQTMQERGILLNQFVLSPRMTPQTQTVVRPSPDLAYSICMFDLKRGQSIIVNAIPYGVYTSVSFFDAQTNNFSTVRIDANSNPVTGSKIILHAPGGTRTPNKDLGRHHVEAPTMSGLMLIRRLAPTRMDYDKVAKLSANDSCALQPDLES